jgi:hypothetical protein
MKSLRDVNCKINLRVASFCPIAVLPIGQKRKLSLCSPCLCGKYMQLITEIRQIRREENENIKGKYGNRKHL